MNENPLKPETQDNESEQAQQPSLLERLSEVLLREPKTREQLIYLLRESEQRHIINPDALSMIEGVIQVSDMQVREVMIPRTQMIVIDQGQKPADFLPTIIESAHSRFPVLGDSQHEVTGILLAKDLLTYYANNGIEEFNIRDILRPAVFIPESKRLNVLLTEFRSNRNHMAIVVDEYGGVSGLITIEDVLEQIVGEIEDESDIDEDVFIHKYSDSTYTVKALTPLEEFNEYFGLKYEEDEIDTIGGLLMRKFGHVPKRGETIIIGQFRFQVLRADNRRIHLLQAFRLKKEDSKQ
ncbi:MAG: CBS domain-containing protein [Gammaproteobacteria bacterium]|nr:CBS domain-containing protein [Gammaproteobacteria bacterium]